IDAVVAGLAPGLLLFITSKIMDKLAENGTTLLPTLPLSVEPVTNVGTSGQCLFCSAPDVERRLKLRIRTPTVSPAEGLLGGHSRMARPVGHSMPERILVFASGIGYRVSAIRTWRA
ncbi:hypothetical protein LCGC14_2326310, partial [marine sediment metagenome]